jgi:hypothetical protein
MGIGSLILLAILNYDIAYGYLNGFFWENFFWLDNITGGNLILLDLTLLFSILIGANQIVSKNGGVSNVMVVL